MAHRDLQDALTARDRALERAVELAVGRKTAPDFADALMVGIAEQSVQEDRVWYSVQAFLSAAANISKLLWPLDRRDGAKQFPDRGAHLRRTLAIEESSLLKNKDLRNHFEHFDERIEEWVPTSLVPFESDAIVASKDHVSRVSELFFVLRHLDPETLVLTVGGTEYELPKIVEEIEVLDQHVQKELAKRTWHESISDAIADRHIPPGQISDA